MEIENLLNNYFSTLYEPELKQKIKDVGIIKHIDSGTPIMDIGQYIKYLPLVVSGSLKVMRQDKEGRELLLYFLEGGNTCAMSFTCCMKQEKSNIRAVAEENSIMIMIPVHYMDEWMDKYKSWKDFVMQTYALRFEELLNTIDAIAFQSLDQRLFKYLKDRSQASKSNIISITHQDIAYELNSSREAISRLLKKLENLNKIKLGRNKIEILKE